VTNYYTAAVHQYLDRAIAVCPECYGSLVVRNQSWDAETGKPYAADLQIDCTRDPHERHRWWQSDWQPVVDLVREWAGAINT
jgi:hypothetical protein